MKKLLSILLVMVISLSCMLVSCNDKCDDEQKEDINAKSEGVMTYDQYAAAAAETEVVIEAYVQGKQAYSEAYGNTSLYLQDGKGGYFVYRISCTAEQYNTIKIGNKIKVTGYKDIWSGEHEIIDATFEIVAGNYVASPEDVTALLGSEGLVNKQNILASFKNLTVVASNKKDDTTDYAFLYNWDGSGEQGNDIYFNVTDGTNTYNFCVETDLCNKDTDVYKAVEALNIGDKIDLEGFLYWYNGANPHITKVTKVG